MQDENDAAEKENIESDADTVDIYKLLEAVNTRVYDDHEELLRKDQPFEKISSFFDLIKSSGDDELNILEGGKEETQDNVNQQNDANANANITQEEEVVAKDNKLIVGGDVDVSVEKGNVRIAVATGNADIYVAGSTDLMVDGNVNATVGGDVTASITGLVDAQIGGTLNANVSGDTTFTSPNTLMTTNLTVDGTVHITGAQTNDSTIVASDTITDSGATLATHTHTIPGGSSAGKTLKPD